MSSPTQTDSMSSSSEKTLSSTSAHPSSWRKRMIDQFTSVANNSHLSPPPVSVPAKAEITSPPVVNISSTIDRSLQIPTKLSELNAFQCYVLLTKYFPSKFEDNGGSAPKGIQNADLIHEKLVTTKISGQDLRYVETVEDLREIVTICPPASGSRSCEYSISELEEMVNTLKGWQNEHNGGIIPNDVISFILNVSDDVSIRSKENESNCLIEKRKFLDDRGNSTTDTNKQEIEDPSLSGIKRPKISGFTNSLVMPPFMKALPVPTPVKATTENKNIPPIPQHSNSNIDQQEEDFLLIFSWQKLKQEGFAMPMPTMNKANAGKSVCPPQDPAGLLLRLRTIQQSLEKLSSWNSMLTLLMQYPYHRRIVQLLCDAYLTFHHNVESIPVTLNVTMNRMFLDLLTYYSMRCFGKKSMKGMKKEKMNDGSDISSSGQMSFPILKPTIHYETDINIVLVLTKVLRLSLYVVDNNYLDIFRLEREQEAKEKVLTFSSAAELIGKPQPQSIPKLGLTSGLLVMNWKDVASIVHLLSILQQVDRDDDEFLINSSTWKPPVQMKVSATNNHVDIVLHVLMILQLVFRLKTLPIALMKTMGSSSQPGLSTSSGETMKEEALMKEQFSIYLWSQCVPVFISILLQRRYQQNQSLIKTMMTMIKEISITYPLQELWVSYIRDPSLPADLCLSHPSLALSCQVLVDLVKFYTSNISMIKIICSAIIPILTPIEAKKLFLSTGLTQALIQVLYSHERSHLSNNETKSMPITTLQGILAIIHSLSCLSESHVLICAPLMDVKEEFDSNQGKRSHSIEIYWLSLLQKFLDKNMTTTVDVQSLIILNHLTGIFANICRDFSICQRFLSINEKESVNNVDKGYLGVCEMLVECLKRALAVLSSLNMTVVPTTQGNTELLVTTAFVMVDYACSAMVTIMGNDLTNASTKAANTSVMTFSSSLMTTDLGCDCLVDALKRVIPHELSSSTLTVNMDKAQYHVLRALQGKVQHNSINASQVAHLGCFEILINSLHVHNRFYCDRNHSLLLQEILYLIRLMCSNHVENTTRCLTLIPIDSSIASSSSILVLDVLLNLLHGYIHDKSPQCSGLVKEICLVAELFFLRLPAISHLIGDGNNESSSTSWFSIVLILIASHKQNEIVVNHALSIAKLTIRSALFQLLAMTSSNSIVTLSVINEHQHQQQKILMTLRSLLSVIEEIVHLYREHHDIINNACCTIVSLLLTLKSHQQQIQSMTSGTTTATTTTPSSVVYTSLSEYLQSPTSTLCIALVELYFIHLQKLQLEIQMKNETSYGMNTSSSSSVIIQQHYSVLFTISYTITQLSSLKFQIAKKFVILSFNVNKNTILQSDCYEVNHEKDSIVTITLTSLILSTLYSLSSTPNNNNSNWSINTLNDEKMIKYLLNMLYELTNYPQLIIQCFHVKDIIIMYSMLRILLPYYCLINGGTETDNNNDSDCTTATTTTTASVTLSYKNYSQQIHNIRKLIFGIFKHLLRYEVSSPSSPSSISTANSSNESMNGINMTNSCLTMSKRRLRYVSNQLGFDDDTVLVTSLYRTLNCMKSSENANWDEAMISDIQIILDMMESNKYSR